MRILLLGANGQVGFELQRSLAPLGEVIPATRRGRLDADTGCATADFDDPQSLPPLLARLRPDVVVNAAAYTAVDRAEDEPDAAQRANAEAPAILAIACRESGTHLVHYSTDYVFDGQQARPWREDDPTAPLGVYGHSKLAGEEAIRASGCRHWIFRTAWVYAARGHNFLRTMLRLGAERDRLRVVCDQIGCPTPARWIAESTALALARGGPASGTWHLVSSGQTSWHGFAEAIFEQARLSGLMPAPPQVEPIPTSAYPTRAARPARSCLDTDRLHADFGLRLPDWREGLRQVLGEMAMPDYPAHPPQNRPIR